MNRSAGLVIAGLVLMVGVTPSWGGPPNPTASDAHGNTAGGTGALDAVKSDPGYGYYNTAFGSNALRKDTTGSDNTAIGADALWSNTTGLQNTATGAAALARNTTGSGNTANGSLALENNTTGVWNTAIGDNALWSNTTGYANTASGRSSLELNTTGEQNTASGAYAMHYTTGNENTASGAYAMHYTTSNQNTASGASALYYNTIGTANTALGYRTLHFSTGNQNIAIGSGAGLALVNGNRNIYVGHRGVSSESKTMRLGAAQTRTFIAGVATTPVSGTNVTINASGQLGTLLSSARYKRDIETMGARSEGLLKLRPVTFVYKQDEQGVRQYGLIAEEVAMVYPELVTHTATGEVQGVRYQELIPLLLNEVQRQQRELAELRTLVGELRGGVAKR